MCITQRSIVETGPPTIFSDSPTAPADTASHRRVVERYRNVRTLSHSCPLSDFDVVRSWRRDQFIQCLVRSLLVCGQPPGWSPAGGLNVKQRQQPEHDLSIRPAPALEGGYARHAPRDPRVQLCTLRTNLRVKLVATTTTSAIMQDVQPQGRARRTAFRQSRRPQRPFGCVDSPGRNCSTADQQQRGDRAVQPKFTNV
jgi:hypothetical protein